jgi:hypothetical protein
LPGWGRAVTFDLGKVFFAPAFEGERGFHLYPNRIKVRIVEHSFDRYLQSVTNCSRRV